MPLKALESAHGWNVDAPPGSGEAPPQEELRAWLSAYALALRQKGIPTHPDEAFWRLFPRHQQSQGWLDEELPKRFFLAFGRHADLATLRALHEVRRCLPKEGWTVLVRRALDLQQHGLVRPGLVGKDIGILGLLEDGELTRLFEPFPTVRAAVEDFGLLLKTLDFEGSPSQRRCLACFDGALAGLDDEQAWSAILTPLDRRSFHQLLWRGRNPGLSTKLLRHLGPGGRFLAPAFFEELIAEGKHLPALFSELRGGLRDQAALHAFDRLFLQQRSDCLKVYRTFLPGLLTPEWVRSFSSASPGALDLLIHTVARWWADWRDRLTELLVREVPREDLRAGVERWLQEDSGRIFEPKFAPFFSGPGLDAQEKRAWALLIGKYISLAETDLDLCRGLDCLEPPEVCDLILARKWPVSGALVRRILPGVGARLDDPRIRARLLEQIEVLAKKHPGLVEDHCKLLPPWYARHLGALFELLGRCPPGSPLAGILTSFEEELKAFALEQPAAVPWAKLAGSPLVPLQRLVLEAVRLAEGQARPPAMGLVAALLDNPDCGVLEEAFELWRRTTERSDPAALTGPLTEQGVLKVLGCIKSLPIRERSGPLLALSLYRNHPHQTKRQLLSAWVNSIPERDPNLQAALKHFWQDGALRAEIRDKVAAFREGWDESGREREAPPPVPGPPAPPGEAGPSPIPGPPRKPSGAWRRAAPRRSRPKPPRPASAEDLERALAGGVGQADPSEASHKPRPHQALFRRVLLAHYPACPVTGCRVRPVLQAAHLFPAGRAETYLPSNGVILRSDIHTLFDKHRLIILPNYDLVWHWNLEADPAYAGLARTARALVLPADLREEFRPSLRGLKLQALKSMVIWRREARTEAEVQRCRSLEELLLSFQDPD